MTHPRIHASVIIATRDRPDELRQCLRSVVQTITEHDEIIVVDSASVRADVVNNIAISAGARVIRTDLVGSARARNIGIRHARGDVIAFTDDDARVDADWLTALMSRFSNPAVAAAVGPVFDLGSPSPAPIFSCADFNPSSDAVSFNRSERDWFARLRFGAIGVGANLAVRRAAFERYGLFRESLGLAAPISGDETYYLLTLVENGETVVNEPSARVYHPLQSPDRLRDLQRCRIAYVLYILVTRPQLRWLSITSLIRGSRRQQPSRSKANNSAERARSIVDLGRGLISAPGLLIAALRVDRNGVDDKNGQRFGVTML